ncbi:hypothetical protein CANARDRAFT_26010 [[Candida] arabinofermentans NRRL YB-2248]|uniref:DNA repair and recombination protein RAD52 n=1 Tax=[Candida] arabinofermentans NRRL YB-2248 TaxID=983967 RepID=A0A1E4T7T5_9ASCO|nr:hypothetical protein CANARDRAFT_26010 [[Candida] arabinofermentans NRRL YB-2248]
MQNHRGQQPPPVAPTTFRYSKEEVDSMRVALEKKLGPEYISNRKGPGYNKINYLEGWKAINLANDIFGPNGWSTEVRGFQVDYIDERNGAISLGISATVRVTLKDGAFHEDVGYGSIDNCKSKSAAFDKCKKEAVTDGMKRALRQYGNSMGNCLYDKDYLLQISKVKPIPLEFDEEKLMRRSHHGSMIKEEEKQQLPAIADEPADAQKSIMPQPQRTMLKQQHEQQQNNRKSPIKPPPRDDAEDSFQFSDDWPDEILPEKVSEDAVLNSEPEFGDDDELETEEINKIIRESNEAKSQDRSSKVLRQVPVPHNSNIPPNQTPFKHTTPVSTQTPAVIPETVTFVTSRSAESVRADPSLQNDMKFDVKNTPSLGKKSNFIDHSKSTPIKRSLISEDSENKSTNTNPMVVVPPKRSIGLPPQKLVASKRLRKS